MIFLVIVFFVLAMIGALSYIDNSNIKKIEAFLQEQNCQEINYTLGTYQGLCQNKIILVDNAFKVDLNHADIVYYNSIKNIEKEKKTLFLKTDYERIPLRFKSDENRDKFYSKLQEDKN